MVGKNKHSLVVCKHTDAITKAMTFGKTSLSFKLRSFFYQHWEFWDFIYSDEIDFKREKHSNIKLRRRRRRFHPQNKSHQKKESLEENRKNGQGEGKRSRRRKLNVVEGTTKPQRARATNAHETSLQYTLFSCFSHS